MVIICVFTLEIIDFRPKIIGEKNLVPQIFKSALQVLLKQFNFGLKNNFEGLEGQHKIIV